MAEHTLTYSDGFKGFPSFYSYIPDYMIGMNNYFYTFKGGDLYRHNVNERRNHFYDDDYSSTMTSVFNDMPLENKLFKTINLESSFAGSSHSWGGTFDTDIQTTGFIDATWFEKKEGAWFAFMRNEPGSTALTSGTNTAIGALVPPFQLIDTSVNFSTLGVAAGDIVSNTSTGDSASVTLVAATILTLDNNVFLSTPEDYSIFDGSPPSELELRSLSGIGNCTTVDSVTVAPDIYINFALTTPIGSSISIGDYIYATTSITPIGEVRNVTRDLPNSINRIRVRSVVNTPVNGNLILYIKNRTAESNGVLGHYCEFVLTNSATEAVELFAVESEIMKSFP